MHFTWQQFIKKKQNRTVRDLLRRRLYYVRQKAELSVHLQNTNHQYNINEPLIASKIATKKYRDTISEKFSNPAVVDMVDSDLYLYDQYHLIISKIEKQIKDLVNLQLPQEFKILQTIPGFGFVIPLTILYEIGDISRFKTVGHFLKTENNSQIREWILYWSFFIDFDFTK